MSNTKTITPRTDELAKHYTGVTCVNPNALLQELLNMETKLSSVESELQQVREELKEAYNEISCCDDVILKVPLTQSIADLCSQRNSALDSLKVCRVAIEGLLSPFEGHAVKDCDEPACIVCFANKAISATTPPPNNATP